MIEYLKLRQYILFLQAKLSRAASRPVKVATLCVAGFRKNHPRRPMVGCGIFT